MPRQSIASLFVFLIGCGSSEEPPPTVQDASFSSWVTPEVLVGEAPAAAARATAVVPDPAPVTPRKLAFERGTRPTLERAIDRGALADATAKPTTTAPRNRIRPGVAAAPTLDRTAAAKTVRLTSARSDAAASRSLSIATKTKGDGLSKNEVRNVVSASMGQVRACYERALKASPSLGGRIVVDWQVTPAGSVATAAIRADDIGDSSLQSCIINTVKGWAFPTATAVTPVSFPFTLKRG